MQLMNVFSLHFLISEGHLTVRQKKHYNSSPARYIRQRRVEQAAQLLRSTSLRISDIAFDCGFADLAHFSKTFQKNYGQSPTAFRLNQLD